LNDCDPSTLKRTLEHHLEDAERWAQNLPDGDSMQMIGWRPTAAVLANQVRIMAARIRVLESELNRSRARERPSSPFPDAHLPYNSKP